MEPLRFSRDFWSVAIEAAMARGHMTVVANLLATELVPAVGTAVAALGRTVVRTSTPPRARHAAWSVEMLPWIDRVAHAHRRACDVLAVAERRREALGGPPPLCCEHDGVSRVLERVLDGIEREQQGLDPWPAIADRLGKALYGLVEPTSLVVTRIDAGELDDAPIVPLKRALLLAYEDVCEALLFALARLDLAPAWTRARTRATA